MTVRSVSSLDVATSAQAIHGMTFDLIARLSPSVNGPRYRAEAYPYLKHKSTTFALPERKTV